MNLVPKMMVLRKVLDFGFWLCFVLVVAGGFPYNNSIQLAYMGDFFHGALALGILGLFLGVDFQSLSFVKAFADFFWGIQNKKMPQNRNSWLVFLGSFWLILAFIIAPHFRHWNYGSWLYDLGLMDQILWRFKSGLGLTSTVLGSAAEPFTYFPHSHINFWLYPIGWIYSILPGAGTLISLQSIFLLLPLIPAYLLAKELFPASIPAALLPVFYWCWDTIHHVNVWDFHLPPFTTFVGLMGYYFWIKKKNLNCALFLILMGLVQEDAWMTAGAMAFYFLVTKRKYISAGACLIGGVAIFLIHVRLLGQLNSIEGTFSYLKGITLGQLALYSLTHPLFVIGKLFRPEALKLIFSVFVVGGGSALASGWALFPILPNLLMCALSTHIGMLSPLSHHIMVASAPLVFAVAMGFSNIDKKFKNPQTRRFIFGSLILIGLTSSWIYTEPSEIRQMTSNNLWENQKCLNQLLSQIPAEAPVYANNPTASHLSERNLYFDLNKFPKGSPGGYTVVDSTNPDHYDLKSWKILDSRCGFNLLTQK